MLVLQLAEARGQISSPFLLFIFITGAGGGLWQLWRYLMLWQEENYKK